MLVPCLFILTDLDVGRPEFDPVQVLTSVQPSLWSGVLLTLVLATVTAVLSFPLGVLLALGRTSRLPVVRACCVGLIEVVRGVPLITILFMAQVMLPMFLPLDLTIDRVLRAIAGMTIFTAAYLAEVIRGGLQAVPREQVEAARALGLSELLVTALVVLPQALRLVIPAIMGQFVSMFKDTTLVAIVGLLELLGILQQHHQAARIPGDGARGLSARRRLLLRHLLRHVPRQPPAGDSARRRHSLRPETMPDIERIDTGDDIIVCENVKKWFGEFQALRGISLRVRRGEVLVIIGPSGSGKSTFIRTINRLEEHQDGRIVVDGIELTHDVRNIAAIRSEIGMVFQQFNLFPHLTVRQNMTLAPIWVRRWPQAKAEAKAVELLDRVGIPEQADKYPGQLSGGQQQRVAIARALAMEPQDHAVRRADVGARSGDDQGSARRHEGAGAHRDHDGRGHPRDGFRPRGRRPDLLLRLRQPGRDRPARSVLPQPAARADQAVPLADPASIGRSEG